MLGANFSLSVSSSRSAALSALKSRCAASPEKDRILWKNAWNRFSVESFDQIPYKLLEAIKVNDKAADKKRSHYEILYKRKAVEVFLPKLEKKLKLLTGKASRQARDTLELLYLWREQLPKTLPLDPQPKRIDLQLKRKSPSPIQLPCPPKQRKPTCPPKKAHGVQPQQVDATGVQEFKEPISSEDESIHFGNTTDISSSDSELHYFVPHPG